MSFSYDAKLEMCKLEPEQSCCEKAECYGLLLCAKSFSLQAVSLVTEHSLVARRAAQLTAQTTGAIVDVRTAVSFHRSSYTLLVQEESQRSQVLAAFGHSGKEISLRVNLANLENDCCKAAFLRGVFLSCGTVTDPNKDYHLELILPYMNLAKDIMSLLREGMDFHPALVNRKGAFVVYIKGGDRIADLLTYMGAGGAAMELMQVRMLKEVRNNVNRKTNFETANIDKTVGASVRQVEAIEKIRDTVGLEVLPEELRETAELRLENPELSLRELGQLFQTPVSRSGVNHRLRRLIEEAENLK
ncbi:MAG: DNA-binding protein WhiA [Clostridium sp.]|uniref:DNA-binding protein WhiA n=1 Tax=Clostridium sp. TaxID=1506 RepID=UPI00290FC0AD|nr:DNA-binding protein WhiA [Clostridium sp.]MDU7337638.1 DNA-binding protein WhiA [Clostridium sp.]